MCRERVTSVRPATTAQAAAASFGGEVDAEQSSAVLLGRNTILQKLNMKKWQVG